MKIRELAGLEGLPKEDSQEIKWLVKHCMAYQCSPCRSRRFLFLIRDPIIEGFNHDLQIEIMSLRHKYILHVIDVGIRFKKREPINKMPIHSTWRPLHQLMMKRPADPTDYIHTDEGANLHSSVTKDQAAEHETTVRNALPKRMITLV